MDGNTGIPIIVGFDGWKCIKYIYSTVCICWPTVTASYSIKSEWDRIILNWCKYWLKGKVSKDMRKHLIFNPDL